MTPVHRAGAFASHVKKSGQPLGPTVLVVDDNPMCRELTVDALRKEGVEVIAARDGYEGMRVLTSLGAILTLLIVDTEMPGVHGWEVIRLAASKTPRTRILRLGRPDDEAPGSEYQAFQGVAVLKKPFTQADLLASVRAQLGRRAERPRESHPSRGRRREG